MAVNISPWVVTKVSNDVRLGGVPVANTVPAPFSTPVTLLKNLPKGSFGEAMRVSAMLPRRY
jgi:hypothetical protein